MARFSESSSDGEEMRALQAPQAVPYEIRSAKRTAATALLVSAAACLCSLGLVIHKQTAALPHVVAPEVSSVVGLSEEDSLQHAAADLESLRSQVQAFQFGMRPVPHHLAAPMALRAEASIGGAVRWQMPAGVQVFPLTKKYGWFQVVVPQTEVDGAKQDATFGWLPEHTDDGAILLVEDTALLNSKVGVSRAAPPSREVVQAKWDEARAKSKALQAQVAELQMSMQRQHQRGQSPAVAEEHSLEERRSKGGAAVKAEVSKVVSLAELSKTAHQLHKSAAKELNAGKLVSSIGKMLG